MTLQLFPISFLATVAQMNNEGPALLYAHCAQLIKCDSATFAIWKYLIWTVMVAGLNVPVANKIRMISNLNSCRTHLYLSFGETINHFATCSDPKPSSSHPDLCENTSVCFLPIHHSTHYTAHLDIHHMSCVQLHNPSHSTLVPPLADDLCPPTMPPEM